MNRFVLLLLLLLAVMAVRLRNGHMAGVTPYSAEQELDKVTEQQRKFEEQFVALTKEVEGVNNVLNSSTNPEVRINALETSLLQWRQDVFDLSKTIIPAFNLSKCSCQGITQEQKSRIINDIDVLRRSVDELRVQAQQMERCDKTEQVISDARKQLFFLDTMREIMTTDCRRSATLGPTIFQTNLYAENWVLGNYSSDDIVKLYNKRAEQYDNVTNCPTDKPFFDGKSCIQCPSNSPVFNIETSQCGNCPSGEQVDNTAKRCTAVGSSGIPPFSTNYQVGKIIAPWGISNVTGVRICHRNRPYYNGHSCIQCYPPNDLFNATSNSCTSCPEGRIYDKEKRDCIVGSNARWHIFNSHPNAPNMLGTRLERNPSLEDCPINRPYFDGNSCIQCEYPHNVFNISSNQCTQCPQGTYLASNECKSISGWNGSSITANSGQFNNNPNVLRIVSRQKIPRNPNLPNCPVERPFFDGTGCINCDAPRDLFNYTSKQCTSCGSGEIYSPDSRSCQQTANSDNANISRQTTWYSNLTNSNWLTINQSPAAIYEEINRGLKQPNARQCPSGRQFFNGKQCIACSPDWYFSFDNKRCERCSWDTKFNLNIHRCIKVDLESQYQTNPNATNIIYDGLPSSNYQSTYRKNIERYPGIKDCPEDRPFYDQVSCIACQPPFPYFNLNRKECQQCATNSTYNPASRQCESTEGKIIYQGPTLEKMLAGIF